MDRRSGFPIPSPPSIIHFTPPGPKHCDDRWPTVRFCAGSGITREAIPAEFYPLGAAWIEVIAWALALGSLPIMAIHKLVVIGVYLLPFAGFAALARYGRLPWSVPVLAIVMHVAVRGWWWSGGYMELIEWGLLTNVASAALCRW